MTSREALTIESSLYPKLFVIEPQSSANNGIAVPIPIAPIVPKNISNLSKISANRNSFKKGTVCSSFFYGSFSYCVS